MRPPLHHAAVGGILGLRTDSVWALKSISLDCSRSKPSQARGGERGRVAEGEGEGEGGWLAEGIEGTRTLSTTSIDQRRHHPTTLASDRLQTNHQAHRQQPPTGALSQLENMIDGFDGSRIEN